MVLGSIQATKSNALIHFQFSADARRIAWFLLRDSINEQNAWSLRVISISIAKTEALAQVVMSNMVRLYNA